MNILKLLPQTSPFRFIDEVIFADENRFVGSYTFKEEEYFYHGHFPGRPVTPGAILIETLAQIGLVAFGIYLLGSKIRDFGDHWPLFTSCQVDFKKAVLPGETVVVTSSKIYFRFQKLKCKVVMETTDSQLICSGILSGIFAERTIN